MKRTIVLASLATIICAGLLFAAGGHKYTGKFQWDYQVTTGTTADSIKVDSLPGKSGYKIFRFDGLDDKGKISGFLYFEVDGCVYDSVFAGVADSTATFEIGVDMKATQ
jgi:hypothetical protein